jgi:hypothetical protein
VSADHQAGRPQQWREVIVPVISLHIVSIVATIAVPALVLLIYVLIWRDPVTMFGSPGLLELSLAGVALVLGVVAHEGLHALGFLLAGCRANDVRFGFNPQYLTIYATADVPISGSAYRFVGALPAVVLGFVPALAGIAIQSAWLTTFGAVMIVFAVGDFMILWYLRAVSSSASVKDHPTKPGFLVLE